MFKKFTKTKLFLILILLFTLLLESCQSTKSLTRNYVEPNAPQDAEFVIAQDVVFPETEGDYKYLFIRLYNPEYKNPFYIANLLKGGIEITKTEDVPDLSHASIGFSLDDNYYGLTSGGKYQFAVESCTVPQNNKYMKNCDPEKSEQITYAYRVTPEEYENTKAFVDFYLNDPKLKYDSLLTVKIGVFFIGKRYFTSKDKREFGKMKYPKSAKNKKVNLNEKNKEKHFVCSTFLAFVLYNNVESITKYFDENDIKYEYLNVTDISLIPGMTPLFYSNWSNYTEAAKAFVEEHPEFADYLTN